MSKEGKEVKCIDGVCAQLIPLEDLELCNVVSEAKSRDEKNAAKHREVLTT
jgi:hypothetical protein